VATCSNLRTVLAEECRMVARRIKAGEERLGLAMNILMEFGAINAGAGNE
jgi:hypothetical protein